MDDAAVVALAEPAQRARVVEDAAQELLRQGAREGVALAHDVAALVGGRIAGVAEEAALAVADREALALVVVLHAAQDGVVAALDGLFPGLGVDLVGFL
ncbi:hypothetical protein [Nannocystis pusilla]|uniref:hypothetical protein n=1 Tax=Nannocystis pusilla TaxID=889268 RepID=UPI003B7E6992